MTTKEALLADTRSFYTMEHDYFVQVDIPVPTEEAKFGYTMQSEYAVLFVLEDAFVVNGDYHLCDTWRKTRPDCFGNAVYEIPASEVKRVLNEVEYNDMCAVRYVRR